jgi:hypothetical protein
VTYVAVSIDEAGAPRVAEATRAGDADHEEKEGTDADPVDVPPGIAGYEYVSRFDRRQMGGRV